MLDNYDSFTYNLVYIVRKLGYDPTIWRNDQFEMEDVRPFEKIILSPGPGIPLEAGLMPELIKNYSPTHSILGVCLGHQALGESFGGTLTNLKEVYHGVATQIRLDAKDPLFKGIPEEIRVGRYHSWAISPVNFPESIRIIATDKEDQIMAIRHKSLDVCGVQFHPESVMTEHGTRMVENWLSS